MFATRTGVPIVPMYIPAQKHWFRPTTVVIGEPYYPQIQGRRATAEENQEIAREIMRRIHALGDFPSEDKDRKFGRLLLRRAPGGGAGGGAARSGEPCVMLGPIIHNQDMMDHLARHGLRAVVRPEEVPEGARSSSAPMGRAALSTRACMPGASASWTPPVPMLPVSIRSWPGLRSRGGSPSSSEPGTTRRCWPLRAGAAARWSCLERRSWKTGWRRTRPDAKCHSLLCPRPRPSAGFGIPA